MAKTPVYVMHCFVGVSYQIYWIVNKSSLTPFRTDQEGVEKREELTAQAAVLVFLPTATRTRRFA
ncbi:MAG: hypothetical protein ACI8PB_004619 [Desulforhopalus sp.]|jgi:hypothetical protein